MAGLERAVMGKKNNGLDSKGRSFTRRAFLKNGIRGAAVLTLGKGLFNSSSYGLELRSQRIALKGLPAGFEGLTIAHLSDLHSSMIVSADLLKAAASLAMDAKPDLIVLTGDFVSGSTKFISSSVGRYDRKYLDRMLSSLSSLKAPLGIFGVLGNHDFWSGPEATGEIINGFEKKLELKWLRNSSVKVKKGADSISLCGVDDYWEASCSLEKALAQTGEGVRILLSHNPDINELIDGRRDRVELVLSGHTHGGQICLPLVGAPFLPSKFGSRYRHGLVRDGARQTYITAGVGHLLLPVRFLAPPEVTLLTLVRGV